MIFHSSRTAVASAKIHPILALANVLKWEKCQSLAIPSFAEYIHNGDRTNLFGNSIPLIFNLENNLDTIIYNIIKKIIFFFFKIILTAYRLTLKL